jgi:hypothetical protein
MKTNFRTILALGAAAALTVGLSACGRDDDNQKVLAGIADTSPQPDWSLSDLATVSPQAVADAPLPRALPMQAAYDESYGTAPAFDYAPQDAGGTYVPLDRSYDVRNARSNDYALLALASALGAMLGNAPPDYAFTYEGVQPWAWRTGDGYRRHAEPIPGGYRYYYYQPRADRPFLVRDPYYSYGYRDGRLAAMYDRDGRLLDWRRLQRQQQAARDYLARAERLYRAAERDRFGVSAPLWERNRAELAREQRQWEQARRERAAWRQWEAANKQPLKREWGGEALVRREAERDFAGWQMASFRTPAPAFYTQQQRRDQLQRLAELRREQAQRAELARREMQAREVRQQQQAQAGQLAEKRAALAQRQAQAREVRQQQQAQADQFAQQRNAQRQLAADRLRAQRERQQAEAAHIAQENAGLAQQRETAPVKAQQAQAKLLTERKAAQAKIAEARQAQAAAQRQAHQADLAKAQQARIAKAREAQTAKLREAQVARAHQAEVAKAREAGLAKAREVQQAKAKLANPERANAAKAKAQQAEAKVRQKREAAAQPSGDAKPNGKPIRAHRRDRG